MILSDGNYRPYVLQQVTLTHKWSGVQNWLMQLEEERSHDIEVAHTPEQVDILALDGHLFGQIVTDHGRDTVSLRFQHPE
jgi:hypothetical protein